MASGPKATSKPRTIFAWRIVCRHEEQGFQKTFAVEAKQVIEAMLSARAMLRDAGYDPEAFEVIEAKRGTIVRLHSTAEYVA